MFILEPLQNIHFEISKLVKQCQFIYLSTSLLCTGGVQRQGNYFVKVRLQVLCGCNLLHSAVESAVALQGIRTDVLKRSY